MKSFIRLSLIFTLAQFILTSPIYPLEIEDRNEYLFDVRGDDGDIYLNRLSLHKKSDPLDMELSGFAEAQWTFETAEWEKLILGLEVGKSLWEYLYIGQSVQFISGQILDHLDLDTDTLSGETTTKIEMGLPFLEDFGFRLFEEYSFNLEATKAVTNEIGAEVTYDFKDSISLGIGWRHTDRIHSFDTDYATSSLTLRF